jgi:hypothetical protein
MSQMMYDESEKGYVNRDGFEVKVSEPRGNYENHFVQVNAVVSEHRSVKVVECELTTDNIKSLRGELENGISTSASVFYLIEEAVSDFDEIGL